MTKAIDKDRKQFNDLTQKRRDHVVSCIRNRDRLRKLVTEKIYSINAHFVYELLQNADDAKAAEISFNIKKESIDIEHNGKEFTIEDIDSITSSGDSDKQKTNAIGMHGIGFKSVFAITDRPEIHSGKWNFAIDDYIVPEECKARARQNCQDTLIYMPFKDGITYEGIAKKIKAQLDKHNLLLFLNHLRRITWHFPDSTVEKRTKEIRKQSKVNGIDVIDIALKQGQQAENYLLFQKEKTAVAYKQDAQRKSIIALEKESPLFVFLPTELRPKLNFLMQIPYITTANRESVNTESSENQNMTKGAATLVADTLPILRNKRFLTGEFFKDILPLSAPTNEGHESIIYSEIYNHIIEKIKNERLLPAAFGEHVTAKEGLMSSQELISLFKDDADFFSSTGSAKWLNAKLNDPHCSNYMGKLDIQKIQWADIYSQISPGFLGTKTDEWMKKFYIAIQNKESYYSTTTRTIPIIRTSDDKHISFLDKDKNPQVFLPNDTETQFDTIKKCFAQDDELKDFRKFMGLRGFELLDEISKLIAPKYEYEHVERVSDDEHSADVKTVYRAYQKNKTIPSSISGKYFLRGIQNEKDVWARHHECYRKTPELSVWWANSKDAVFFDDKHYQHFAGQWGQDEYDKFFRALGVSDSIKCINQTRLVQHYHGNHYVAEGNFHPNFDVVGLDFALALDNINLERSKIIWRLASRDYHGWFFGKTKRSTRQDDVYNANPKDEKSIAGKRLLGFDWLYDNNKELISRNKHKDLTLDNLHPEYFSSEVPSRQDDELGEHLGLKSRKESEVAKYLAENGKIAVNKQELDAKDQKIENLEEKIKQLEQSSEKSQPSSETIWEPEVSPEEAKCTITKAIKTPRPQPIPGDGGANPPPGDPINEPKFSNPQDIGEWAEKYVLHHLKGEYPNCDVSTRNEDTNQIGYDILVKQNGENGEIIKYVEVKGKVGDRPSYVEISNRQWEMACEHGEKYAIYVVTNAGEANVGLYPIENPKQKFVDGELDAQPIKIKI